MKKMYWSLITLAVSLPAMSLLLTKGAGEEAEKLFSQQTLQQRASFIASQEDAAKLASGADLVRKVPMEPTIENVKKGRALYLLSNGIEFSGEEKTLPELQYQYPIYIPTIKGLKNKKVEEALNAAILSDVKAFLLEGKKAYQIKEIQYIDVSFMTSVNNVVGIRAALHFGRDEKGDRTVANGFMYSLKDASRLTLRDVFTEGTDYIPILNRGIIEALLSENINEEEVYSMPFQGLKEPVRFGVDENGISIFISKGEFGFATDKTVTIPLYKMDKVVRVFDRFVGEEEKLYERMEAVYKRNNVSTQLKGKIVRGPGYRWDIQYTEVTNGPNMRFLEGINAALRKRVEEIANDPNFLKPYLSKKPEPSGNEPEQTNDSYTTSIYPTCNSYGKLAFEETFWGTNVSQSGVVHGFCYDIRKMEKIDVKNAFERLVLEKEGATKTVEDKVDSYVKQELANRRQQVQEQKIEPEEPQDKGMHDGTGSVAEATSDEGAYSLERILKEASIHLTDEGFNIFLPLKDSVGISFMAMIYIDIKEMFGMTKEEFFNAIY